MFKDKYKKDNENINLSETSKEEVMQKLYATPEKRRIPVRGIIASAVAACLVIGAIFAVKQTMPNFTAMPEKTVVASVTYDDIYDSMKGIIKKRQPGLLESIGDFFGFGGMAKDFTVYENEMITDDAMLNGAMPESTTGTADDGTNSSTTNNQVAGVDEADIVKNDGRYIYSISHGRLIITDTNSGAPVKVSETSLGGDNVINMFISGNRLAVISTFYDNYGSEEKTGVSVYSIDNKSDPFMMAKVTQSGSYHNSRMIDGTVYLLSNYYVYKDIIHRDKPEEYVPCINSRPIEAECISMIKGFEQPTYLVISAVDILTAQSTEKSAVLGGAENVYCTSENLYYTFTSYNSVKKGNIQATENQTTIVKLSLSKDEIKNLATGTVKGCPLNQFSMDEYEGNLRIVTTNNKTVTENVIYGNGFATYDSSVSSVTSASSNSLYVLDGELKVIGKLENLAKDERVYSVRFDKNVGYFVTFRQVDPLFTVDLTDPKKPAVMSALKIPGFSEYLHPYGEGLLFGFGKEATESGSVTGLKLSMFDVSDPYNVTEADKERINADYSDASYDHKAIMVDAKKDIIAFTAYRYGGEAELYVYGYDKETGFVLKNNSVIEGENYLTNCRFVYIGDYFYLVSTYGITTFSMTDFANLGHLYF